ncbi:hypothetical protein [Leptothrix discophora]|uniref:Single-stranded DNA-binding protein n=1 Tax=Leptothrix discophora TaxID=89 RepID=A0ABT9G1L4_LEPDI|nr:hypothetical protein [Leptothrix discophora]MDP4300373.1 hypothetical protein [Leptothrix discophora]
MNALPMSALQMTPSAAAVQTPAHTATQTPKQPARPPSLRPAHLPPWTEPARISVVLTGTLTRDARWSIEPHGATPRAVTLLTIEQPGDLPPIHVRHVSGDSYAHLHASKAKAELLTAGTRVRVYGNALDRGPDPRGRAHVSVLGVTDIVPLDLPPPRALGGSDREPAADAAPIALPSPAITHTPRTPS